jgi:hypothetical protein
VLALQEGLPGGLPVAIPPRVGPLFIVLPHPLIHIHLKLFQGTVQLLSEEPAVALVLHRLMKPLTDAVGLGMVGLGLRVVNIFNRQVELVGVVLWLATVLCASAAQDAL